MKNYYLINSVSYLLILFSIPLGMTAQNELINNTLYETLIVETTNSNPPNTNVSNILNLVWESNGATMANSGVNVTFNLGSSNISTTTEVINRKWKFVETIGDTGNVRVSIPTTSLSIGLPIFNKTDTYVMIVSDNVSFTSGLKTIFMSNLGANQSCLYDFEGTKFITFGLAHQLISASHLTLDGNNDFVKINGVNEINATFSIMTWIRPNGANTFENERTIIAKKGNASSGYQLVLQTNNKIRMEWSVNGSNYSAVSNTVLPNLKWHNIAITYALNTLSIYIDGVLDNSATITIAPVPSSSSFCIGGQYTNPNNINNLFKGDIDELRMWDEKISADQIRFIMNQEILQNNLRTKGALLPKTVTKNEINTLKWKNLIAYYSMNSYIGTYLDDDSENDNRGNLANSNLISINPQTAPIPYKSNSDGLWSTITSWNNGVLQEIPNSLSIVDGVTPINWNIVLTNHNIESSGNKKLLGLVVNSNTFSATNNSKIEITHYLKLNGKIDLVGKSQLIQTLNSDLDASSSGSLERDQQGQNSIYNYNYWSSPVGGINATTNNNAFTIASVMKDGTTSIPQNINWISGFNGSPTSPISLCNYWIYKFQNTTGTYANWQALGSSGLLNPGQGFTLKGSGTSASSQNYTFVGKPNNGVITSTIGPNNFNLSGNPYPSALDVDAFINTNNSVITGTLYFWEHSNTNSSHNLVAYQGSYAQRNKVGGTPAISYSTLNNLNSNSKIPKRFVPVGQGFFVIGSATGGTLTFNNNQRSFIKESNITFSNALLRSNLTMLNVDYFNDNSEDDEPTLSNYKKLRLGFIDSNGYHRQVLMGFMEENATNGIDPGYDAVHLDNQPNDMYFLNGNTKINIAGEGFFNVNAIYPIGVKTNTIGTVTFKLDEFENFDGTFKAFIHDNQTNIYHNIRNNNFTIELPQGVFNTRFSLRFQHGVSQKTNEDNLANEITVAYTSSDNILYIKNNLSDVSVEKVTLFNLLGQAVSNWNVENEDQKDIQLLIKNLSTGTYIVKIKTNEGESSKKIMIN